MSYPTTSATRSCTSRESISSRGLHTQSNRAAIACLLFWFTAAKGAASILRRHRWARCSPKWFHLLSAHTHTHRSGLSAAPPRSCSRRRSAVAFAAAYARTTLLDGRDGTSRQRGGVGSARARGRRSLTRCVGRAKREPPPRARATRVGEPWERRPR